MVFSIPEQYTTLFRKSLRCTTKYRSKLISFTKFLKSSKRIAGIKLQLYFANIFVAPRNIVVITLINSL